jgi:hypothetical protein
MGNTPVDDIEIEIMDEDETSTPPRKKFQDQTQDTVDLQLITVGVVPPKPIFFHPLTKQQRKTACKKMGLFCSSNHPHPTNCGEGTRLTNPQLAPLIYVPVAGDNHCYFHTISYLLAGVDYLHDTLRRVIADYVEKPTNLAKLRSYIPTEFKTGKDYVVGRRMRGSGWGTEVELFATAQIIGHDVVSYSGYGKWERYVGSGNSVDTSKYSVYISNASGNHFEPVTEF